MSGGYKGYLRLFTIAYGMDNVKEFAKDTLLSGFKTEQLHYWTHDQTYFENTAVLKGLHVDPT